MANTIPTKDVAKHIRKVLKSQFPGTKFSVITKSDMIRVAYVDGPTKQEVEEVCNAYRSKFNWNYERQCYTGDRTVQIDGEWVLTAVERFYINRDMTVDFCQEVLNHAESHYTLKSAVSIEQHISSETGYFHSNNVNDTYLLEQIAGRCPAGSVKETEEARWAAEREKSQQIDTEEVEEKTKEPQLVTDIVAQQVVTVPVNLTVHVCGEKNKELYLHHEAYDNGETYQDDITVRHVFELGAEGCTFLSRNLDARYDFLEGIGADRPRWVLLINLDQDWAIAVETRGDNLIHSVGILGEREDEAAAIAKLGTIDSETGKPAISFIPPGQLAIDFNSQPIQELPQPEEPQPEVAYKGVLVKVFRNHHGENDKDILSQQYDEFLVVGDNLPQQAEETNPEKVLRLKTRLDEKYLQPITIEEFTVHGGNFAYSTEFSQLLPIHDYVDYTDYDAKLDAKRERYEARAEKAVEESNTAYQNAKRIGDRIPFGQPVLIGHHSEKGHRADLKRIDNSMRKSVDATKKADYYSDKADSVGECGISSDDPYAVDKIKDRLQELIDLQEEMKAANKLIRSEDRQGLMDMGYDEALITKLFTPDFAQRIGYPNYLLQNNNQEIRRLKLRVEELEAKQNEVFEAVDYENYRVEYDPEDNRIRIIFDGKPADEIRSKLKELGFKWSKTNLAWQRMYSSNSKFSTNVFNGWLEEYYQHN